MPFLSFRKEDFLSFVKPERRIVEYKSDDSLAIESQELDAFRNDTPIDRAIDGWTFLAAEHLAARLRRLIQHLAVLRFHSGDDVVDDAEFGSGRGARRTRQFLVVDVPPLEHLVVLARLAQLHRHLGSSSSGILKATYGAKVTVVPTRIS